MQSTEISSDAALERWRGRVASQVPKTGSTNARQRAPREPMEQPRTIAEAASELALSVYTIRSWVATRRIGHIRLGRVIRIPASEIRRVIEENTVPATKER